jgi:hypothetical protein
MTIGEKVARYYPGEWVAAGGEVDIAAAAFADELSRQSSLLKDKRAVEIVDSAVEQLRRLR